MLNGLKQIEPGDDEHAKFREMKDGLNIAEEDLQAWSVSDFKNRRPPTEAQMIGMLCFCKKWDPMSNIFDMRFNSSDLDNFETVINDYVFSGTERND
jgi:hypothetical protein